MKNIIEYQNEYWLNKSLINESFGSKILQEITNQLNERIRINKEINMESGWKKNDTVTNFKMILGKDSFVLWNKVSDDMFIEYSKDDPKGVKLVKQMISNRSTSFPGMCILLNDDPDSPKYNGCIISTSYWNSRYYGFWMNCSINGNDIKPSEVEGFLTNKFLIINFKENNLMADGLQNERSNSKSGTLNLWNDKDTREYDYKKILERNRERYKAYVSKVRASKDLNDGMADKVTEYSEKILDVVAKMSKNPIKYAKYEYEVGYLLDLLNSRRTYSTNGRSGGYYSGTDGLITVYKTYIKSKLSMGKGDSYDYERKDYEAAKKKLEEIFNTIDEKLKKFEDVE